MQFVRHLLITELPKVVGEGFFGGFAIHKTRSCAFFLNHVFTVAPALEDDVDNATRLALQVGLVVSVLLLLLLRLRSRGRAPLALPPPLALDHPGQGIGAAAVQLPTQTAGALQLAQVAVERVQRAEVHRRRLRFQGWL